MTERETTPYTPELYVYTLGRFAVRRGDALLPEQIWGRATAVRLFQYLLTHRGQYMARERITTDLWPDLDAVRADRNFKVALNALNQVLEPDRPARSPSIFVTRQQLSYGLNAVAPLSLDVVDFEEGLVKASRQEAANPDQAILHYREALQQYKGEYIPDAIYEDWASAERERLSTLFLSGATRLARLLLDAGQPVEVLLWCQRAIRMDACWEEAYRLLMRGYVASGNRPMAIRVYRQCETALKEELGVEPMAETKRLHEELL